MDNRIGSSPGSIPQPEITPENEVESAKSTSIGSGDSTIQSNLPNENIKPTGYELKSELNVSGDLIKANLNQQLSGNQKADNKPAPTFGPGEDNVHISKAPGPLGDMGLYEVNINGTKLYYTKEQLEHTDFNLGHGDDNLIQVDNKKQMLEGGGNDAKRKAIEGGGGSD